MIYNNEEMVAVGATFSATTSVQAFGKKISLEGPGTYIIQAHFGYYGVTGTPWTRQGIRTTENSYQSVVYDTTYASSREVICAGLIHINTSTQLEYYYSINSNGNSYGVYVSVYKLD